jgi:hypothetical protein
MALADLKVSMFAFPQKWENGAIHLRALLLPTGSPLVPPTGMPKFAGREWQLRAVVLSGLNGFWSANPTSGAVLPPVPTVLTPPDGAEALFEALRDNLGISDAAPIAAEQTARLSSLGNTRIKKQLPPSYTGAFAFERSRTDDAGVGDEFGCALRDVIGGEKNDPKPSDQVSWGRIIAYALRQPELAAALGLLYRDLQVPVGDITQLKHGGWLYLELDPAAPDQIVPPPDAVRSYAARLPALDQVPRGLFAAVLFPVGQASQAGYDEPLAEAAVYDDGFAKIMHSFQPDTADAASSGHNKLGPATDCGIDLGWDDEQVVIWHNRQLESARVRLGGAAMKPSVEAPLGVAGYRIDVRPEGAAGWQSLCNVHSVDDNGNPAPLVFPPQPPAAFSKSFAGELTVEPAPARNRSADSKNAWLPRYFTRWHGRSLVVNDDTLFRLTGGVPKKADGTPLNPPQSQSYAPDGANIELLYGEVHEFRCRLADLTGGGPSDGNEPERPAPAPTTKLRFLRHVPPKALRVATDPPAPATGAATHVIRQIDSLSLRRPLMGYPEFIFAGVDRAKVLQGADNLFTQVAAAQQNQSAIGVADPDVAQVEISVQVRLPAHDPGPAGTRDGQFRKIYTVTRDFAAYDFNNPLADQAPLQIGLDYVDVHDLEAFVAGIDANPLGAADDLPIPRARDVRLRLTPICADIANRYAKQEVRRGLTIDLVTRAPALDESDLFVPNAPERELNGIFLQPGEHLMQRLAQHLDLTVKNLTFAPKPGRRVVFGASSALRHSLTGDHGTIAFAAESELRSHWLVMIVLDLDRDWTWDGLQDRSFEIARRDTPQSAERVVGQIDVRFAVNELALLGEDALFPDRRTTTRLIFFDAVDPVPPPGQFPKIAHPTWIVRPRLRESAAAPGDAALAWSQDIEFPIASPPRQMPKVVSAGVALSPYMREEPGYSSTEPRRRALWLKFEEPIADPNDRLFARVLAYGPDPLLSGDITHKLFPPQILGDKFDPRSYAEHTPLPGTSEPDPPQLPIDPELIRVIVPNQPEDSSGLDAMLELTPDASGTRFLMPLPPGVEPDAPELFGFWTYEIRVGHKDIWSTAQARFGRPLRIAGVQHPAPTLSCFTHRVVPPEGPAAAFELPARIVVTAPYATAVYGDQKLTNAATGDPRTRIWIMLYAQVRQADGSTWRNVLLGRKFAWPQFDPNPASEVKRTSARDVLGRAEFEFKAIETVLANLALPPDSPLSVMAVELLPGGGMTPVIYHFGSGTAVGAADNPEPPPADPFVSPFAGISFQTAATSDPLGRDLGTIRSHRILRASPLTPVPPGC